MSFRMLVVLVGCLVLLSGHSVWGAEPTRPEYSIREVLAGLPEGSSLRLTGHGLRARGKIAAVDTGVVRLRLWQRGRYRDTEIPLASIQRIEIRKGENTTNHAILGGAIGFGVIFGIRALIGGDYDGDTDAAMKDFAIVGLAGAGLGAGLGVYLGSSWHEVYASGDPEVARGAMPGRGVDVTFVWAWAR